MVEEPLKVEVLAANGRGLKPRDRDSLLKRLVRESGVPLDLRVSPRFVEAIFFGKPGREALEALEREAGGPIVEVVEGEPVPEGPGAVDEVRRYFREGYYWRAHVASEEAWHRGGGEPARAMALVAGALAKAQEGRVEPALRILAKAREASPEGFDYECLERAVREVAEGRSVDASECIDWEWASRVLAPLTRGGRG